MLPCRALLCASLITSTSAIDRLALPRSYLNTTISSPTSSLSSITSPMPINDDDSSMTLWNLLSSSSTLAPSNIQTSKAETLSNTSIFLGITPTVALPTIPSSTKSCVVRAPGQPRIEYIILPNPVTITQTLGANYTAPIKPKIPEFTPPTFCPTTAPPIPVPSSVTRSGGERPKPTKPPIATFTASNPNESHSPKSSPSAISPSTAAEPYTLISAPMASTVNDGDVTTIITTSKNPVTIYTTVSAPLYPGAEDSMNKQTVDPAMEGGPNGNSSPFPTDSPRAGDIPVGQVVNPIITTIGGHPIEIQSSYVVVGGITHSFVEPIKTGTDFIPTQSTGGVTAGASDTPKSTNVLVVDGGVLTAIGSSLAVFDGQTLQYGPSSTFETDFHRETITLGSSIAFDGTTIGGAENIGTQVGIAGGISVTQVGQSVAIISSTSLTIGPQAVITTIYIDTYTIVVNPGGLEVYGTTLSYPFNPATTILTFEGIAFTKIGSTIVVISGSTYTIGSTSDSKSKSVSKTTSFSRQTISVDSNGSGNPTISLDSATPAETSKKSDSNLLEPVYIVFGICIWTSFYSVL